METLRIKRLLPEERYGILGLLRNPFPSDGASLNPPRLTVYPKVQLKEELEDFLNSLLHRARGAKGRALIGGYGSGKTHYLRHVEYFLRERYPEVATFYIEHPGYGFHDFCGSVIGAIGLTNIVSKLWSVIREELLHRLRRKDLDWYYTIFPQDRGKVSLFGDIEYEHILTDYRGFLDQAKKKKAEVGVLLSVFAQTLQHSLDQSERGAHKLSRLIVESHYKSYFDWGDVSLSKQKEIGDYEFLTSVLVLLRKVDDYRSILMLVDEFEEVPASKRFTVKEATDYEYTIRRLLDLASDVPLGMIIAMTPYAWDLTKEYCEPLSSRLLRPMWIEPLDEIGVRKLILAYLNDGRKGKKSSLDPFPDEMWELLPDVVRDNPRNLLNYCHELVESAASKQIPHITVQLVKQYAEMWKLGFA